MDRTWSQTSWSDECLAGDSFVCTVAIVFHSEASMLLLSSIPKPQCCYCLPFRSLMFTHLYGALLCVDRCFCPLHLLLLALLELFIASVWLWQASSTGPTVNQYQFGLHPSKTSELIPKVVSVFTRHIPAIRRGTTKTISLLRCNNNISTTVLHSTVPHKQHQRDDLQTPLISPSASENSYLNNKDLWGLCTEPKNVVEFNVGLFSTLLVASGLQLVLCAFQMINGLFGCLCGTCKANKEVTLLLLIL